MIDSSNQNEIMRESTSKFYAPKLLLTFLSWVFLLAGTTTVKLYDLASINNQYSVDRMIFWSFTIVILSYFVYLTNLVFQGWSARSNLRLVIIYTFLTSITIITPIIFTNFKVYASNTGTSDVSIDNFEFLIAYLNLYLYVIAYLYSPCVMSKESMMEMQKEKEHRKIINNLYEQELPEMPTMREDTESYNDKNVGGYQLPADEEAEPKRRSTDPDQQKKEEIWQAIQKEVDKGNSFYQVLNLYYLSFHSLELTVL